MFEESLNESWALRYGSEPVGLPGGLDKFLTHRCVRRYSDKPVPVALMSLLVGAAQSAATSSNLQMYSIISVQEPERRDAIFKLCATQEQVRTAPWFLAFVADHHRVKKAAKATNQNTDGLDTLEMYTIAVVDAALAAERMVCAAEAAGLGVCYIGALRDNPEGVAELLGLPEGVFGVFGLCIGYPAEDLKAEIKPRLSQKAIWFREKYEVDADVAEYDERMRGFYTSHGMKGEATWTMRSGRRVGIPYLSGREKLLGWLQGRGFLRR